MIQRKRVTGLYVTFPFQIVIKHYYNSIEMRLFVNSNKNYLNSQFDLLLMTDVKVIFANLNFAFVIFQDKYKLVCQQVSENNKKDIYKSFKKIKSFIYEYLNYVRENTVRQQITNSLDRINKDIMNDEDYIKLSKSNSLQDMIIFNRKYYNYLVRMFRVLGIFGDDLGSTFMPTKNNREKLFKYNNTNPFFEHFTYYKSNLSDKTSEFNVFDFKTSFDYLLGFYYAYYTFVDVESRLLIDRVFTNILSIILDHRILSHIVKGWKNLNYDERLFIKDIDNKMHDAILNIIFRLNYSYSQYGIMPRIENKIIIDRTTI